MNSPDTGQDDVGGNHGSAVTSLEDSGGVLQVIAFHADVLLHSTDVCILKGLKVEELYTRSVSRALTCMLTTEKLALVKNVRHPKVRIMKSNLNNRAFSSLEVLSSYHLHLSYHLLGATGSGAVEATVEPAIASRSPTDFARGRDTQVRSCQS